MSLPVQLFALFILPMAIASIAWTVTHEEFFREWREWCKGKNSTCRRLYEKKFFYVFGCEYCFSHYVTALTLVVTRFHLVYDDWRGYFVAGFALVWIANVYMSIYGRIRLDIRRERVEIAAKEQPPPLEPAGRRRLT